MKDHGTAFDGSRGTSPVRRWLRPRRLVMVAASGLALGGGLFGVLSTALPARAASFTVDTTADVVLANPSGTTCNTAGSCSLRAAIAASDNLGGTNVITLPTGTYNLTLGEIVVGHAGNITVTIDGAGSASSIIHASQLVTCTSSSASTCFRVFDVDPGLHGNVNFTVSGVTISGGRSASFGGPAIINGTGSASPFDTTTVTNSVISDNVNYGPATSTGGAVAQTYGVMTVSGSTFTNNGAGGGAGGAIYESLGNGQLSVTNSTFSGNTASVDGGAIFLGGSNTDSISGSSFTSNTSTSNGGGVDVGGTANLTISNSTFTTNTGGRGGGVKASGGTTTLTNDTFTGNISTGNGGAVAVEAVTSASGLTMTGNTASSGMGGGVYVDATASLTMQYSRLYQNTASSGNQAGAETGAVVSMPNNWWGSNAGPSTGISGFTAPTVWQVLTSTASPNPIRINQTSTFTASTDRTNTNATIAPGHHMPDVPVAFANGALGTVSPTSGTISGGSATTTYTAGSTGGLDSVPTTVDGQTVQGSIEVDQPPTITSANNATFLVGASVSCTPTLSNCFHVTATGYPAPTFSETGALPSGVTLATNGTLSGTPATGTGGVYGITITATNGITPDATQSFTLTVNEAPHITSANTTTFTTGSPGTFTVTSRGYPLPTITLTSGSLPGGVTYDSSTHVLSGTPAAGTGGTYSLQFTSYNGIGTDSVQSFTLVVDQPASITSGSSATFTTGSAGSFGVATAGYPAPTLSDGGATLPSGVTFVDNGGGTATLAGTPDAGTGGTYSFTITAHNGVGSDATQSFTLTVDQPAAITSADNTTFTTGAAGTFAVTTSGFPTVSTIDDGGATLPSGVTFTDNGNGTATLAGTPAAGTGGTYPFTITAHNGIGSDATQSFTLTVDQPAAITSAASTTFTTGTPGTFGVTTSGIPHPTIDDGGAPLPSGVTFTDNGNGTATLAGTPAAGTGGTYPFTITAHNGIGSDATQSFTLTVDQPAAVTSADNTTFATGAAGTFSVTTSGVPTPTLSDGGATLPSGVTFTDNGNGTATLAGTPAAGTGGTYPFTITAHNGIGSDGTQSFTLTVDQPPAITSADHTTFTIGTAGSFTVTTSGFPTVTAVTESGTLPGGVTFTDNGNGTATLAGTPTSTSAGSYPVTLGATNGVAPDASQSFTLTVQGAPQFTSADHTTFTTGAAGTFAITATGSTPMTIQETGSLPSGVTFTDNGGGSATLAGTPAAGTGGTYPLTLTAHNSQSPDAVQSFTLTVGQPAAITSGSSATFTVGTGGTFGVTTSGFPAPALDDGGAALPGGVTFVDNGNGTATLSGTPAPSSGGVYSFTITAHNGVGSDATQSFTLTVDEAPSITSSNTTTFTAGSFGTFTVQTVGYPAPSIGETGSVPSGLTYTDNGNGTATLSGTPAAGTGGVYDLDLTAHNGVGSDATQTLAVTVDEAPSITSAGSTTFTAGSSNTFAVTTGGYPRPSLSDGGATLPSGVTFVDNGNGTATLSGTPAAGSGGVYAFTISAHNGVGSDAIQAFTLTVNEAPAFTSADNTTFTVGSSGNFPITTHGYPHPTIDESGTLPGGVSFTDNGDGTASLAGTPATSSGGVYHIDLTATNTSGSPATQHFTLTVDEALAITSANSTTFTVGSLGNFNVTTRGFPTPSLSKTGSLPSGVGFTDNGDGTATLNGTPAAGTGGTYALTITAHNGQSPDAVQSFTLTVDEAASVTSASSTTFTTGSAGSFPVTTRGYPKPSLGETGALPSGVTFHDNGNGTATLAGTPGSTTGGVYPLTITAHNGVGSDGTQSFTLTVDQPAGISSANNTTFTAGSSNTFSVTATGYPVPSITETGTLPSGVTFHDNGNGTGTLSGTPATNTGGVYHISFKAHNGIGSDATQSFTLTVDEAAAITSANTVTFQVNAPGTFTVTTRGYPIPSLSESGALPSGVTFHDNGDGTATLSGTPGNGTSGSYPLTLTAHNGVGSNGTQAFTLVVGAAPTTTTVVPSTATPNFGQPDTFTATVAPVSPSTGTPAGNVTFSVDGVSTAVVALTSGHASWTTSQLQQGVHTVAAAYGGQTNTYQPSSGSTSVTVGCAVVYTNRIAGALTISGGSACINNARISGGVSISNGASVSIQNSTIGGGLNSSGAALITLCGSTAGGSMSITGTTGFVLVGANGDDAATPCTGNSVNGGMTISNNSGGVELGANSIKGSVVFSNNVLQGAAVDSENGAPELENNSVRGSLTCNGNTPAPTNDGAPNTVTGSRSGQCSAHNF